MGINPDILPRKILALLGENSAGLSTLVKTLYEFYQSEAGNISLKGTQIRIRSPQEARNYGIGLVSQDFGQMSAFTVFEKIILFFSSSWESSIGERQKVELIKLLLAEANILIFDEPTRNLAPHEIEGLFQVFANLPRHGYSIIFIIPKLKEALECAACLAVGRQGQITENELPGRLLGKNLSSSYLARRSWNFPLAPEPR